MYSSFPNITDRYYITNEKNEIIPTFLVLNVHTAELKQRINNHFNSQTLSEKNISTTYQYVLRNIIYSNLNNDELTIDSIKLWKESIEMNNFIIETKATFLISEQYN